MLILHTQMVLVFGVFWAGTTTSFTRFTGFSEPLALEPQHDGSGVSAGKRSLFLLLFLA
jgi:hypothetical protein